MKLKSVAAAALGAALLCLTAGCSVSDIGKEDLLRPPKTMGDEAEIEALISKAAPHGYTLKYPKNGNYRSAIIMHDINGDNVDEAIAFFREKDSAAGVHMLMMCDIDGEWEVTGDFVTETADVDCVDFADINDNDSQEIVVGYATYTSNVNFLSVYSYENGKTNAVDSGQNYSAFYCGNFDGSGKSNIITLSLFTTENEAKATMLAYNSNRGALVTKAAAAMDPNVVSYMNMAQTELGDGVKGLVIDGTLSSGGLNTQIVYYNKTKKALENPLYKDKKLNTTQRSSAILSTDIGNDLKYEIPTVTTLPFNEASGAYTAADQVVWNNFSLEQEQLVAVQRTVANYNYAYTIKIPDTWEQGSFTALLNESGDEMRFCEWADKQAGKTVFEIRVFKVADWDKGVGSDRYTLIYKDNRYAYTFINQSTESVLAMENDQIKTAFSLLNQTLNASSK